VADKTLQIPVQPVERPILCSPYEEPDMHWLYDSKTGEPRKQSGRRDAGYWYKTDKVGAAQTKMFVEEERDDLELVNALRKDVERWRESGYRGASNVTRDLLAHWNSKDRGRRLFFCQLEAVETIIYLAEIRIPGRSTKTLFGKFAVSDDDLKQLLRGERPGFYQTATDYFPTLIDPPLDTRLLPLQRLGCKMATGSGKTVVMAMLIAWAFCNRGANPNSKEFPNAVLVVCPNLTVRERLQVLRPEDLKNYYTEFDIVPVKYRPLMQKGKVLVTNWHLFNPQSEHEEGGKSYAVVDKGPETPETFARRVLGDDLYERMPIMVLNDEGHHCWRPLPNGNGEPRDSGRELEEEEEAARVWVQGLDKINNVSPDGPKARGVGLCVDLSATPFYISGSGHPEGRPFPWLVSDFGLVDAIESGIVKIPRMPVMDVTGLPDPKYFKLWETMRAHLQPADFLPGKARKPKPEVVYRESEGALQQLAGQWKERFEYVKNAKPGQEQIPPVMIVVCDNTDIAELVFEKISGETKVEQVTQADIEEEEDEEQGSAKGKGKSKAKWVTSYGLSEVLPEFQNTIERKHTIRIDTKLLAEAESRDPKKGKKDFAEELREVVATVGKRGQPGEHVRCVVSVGMLTEGWDANNVTHILGIRAFGSQLLCEQVVGRGLRRMDYTPIKADDGKELLVEEYVDVYGIPFSVIPFKGRAVSATATEDKPKQHVVALPERKAMEIRFPVVEGYAFALKKNLIKCDVASMQGLVVEPHREPTATFLTPTIGYREGHAASTSLALELVEQDRRTYYEQNHIETIKFNIARIIVEHLARATHSDGDRKARVFRLQSKHQLFPQVFAKVDEYVRTKVNFQGEHHSELGLGIYVQRIIERLLSAIEPDDESGEMPLMPILNRYKPIGSTAEVEFKTTRPCFPTFMSHINQVVADTQQWEQAAAFRIEMAAKRGHVLYYAKNDHLGLMIPYEYFGVEHNYIPDYLVRLKNGVTLLLEVKGQETNETHAKHDAARRWISAVNNWGKLGIWDLHMNRNPQMLERELEYVISAETGAIAQTGPQTAEFAAP
jgi:type III restriction enzyme